MKTTQDQASSRLFKKLSALRATLSNEERAILDQLIVVEDVNVDNVNTNVNEVTAHKMNIKAVEKASTKANTKANTVAAHKMNNKATTKANTKANTVAAHKMNNKATTKANTKANTVAAHKMNTKASGKATNKANTKATNKPTFRIAFDPDSQEYKIQD